MKKFIIAASILCLLAFFLVYQFLGASRVIDLRPNEPVKTWVRQVGKTIQIDRGQGWEDFEIRGVNLGAGKPGAFATEYAIDKETYLRWFQQIKAMGANCIRTYTLLGTPFYEAFYEYNEGNPDPLYLIAGVWINDYVQNSHMDAFDPAYIGQFKRDACTMVDVVHGSRWIELGRVSGTGTYTKDISPWVLGYLLGVEWEAPTVKYTDEKNRGSKSFRGSYLSTHSDASPFEAMLAEVGDALFSYESARYKQQRLVAFSNWPTTDPFEYPQALALFFEKYSRVDVEHILFSENVVSGTFASYHVYPYYPDYHFYMPETEAVVDSRGEVNTYYSYVKTLADYHSVPLVIAEFGIPTARGMAQRDANTCRNQGGMSEAGQGSALVRCYRDIMDAGCAGAIVFTWQDEWFKRTWNTMAHVDLLKTPFWSDYQTNEQYFGLLSFDPGNEQSVCYVDGHDGDWNDLDKIGEVEGYELSAKWDEKYLYLLVRGSADAPVGMDVPLYLPIDTTPKTGSRFCHVLTVPCPPLAFDRDADFLVVIDSDHNSRVLVQERYEVLRATQLRATTGEDPFVNIPASNSSLFKPIQLVLQTITDNEVIKRAVAGHKNAFDSSAQFRFDVYETGKLMMGNGNPFSRQFNSLADFMFGNGFLELRLPWQLLNFSNPSEMQIHDDYYEQYGVENLAIKSLAIGVGDGSQIVHSVELPLEGWGRQVTYHERLKSGYYALQRLWTGKATAEEVIQSFDKAEAVLSVDDPRSCTCGKRPSADSLASVNTSQSMGSELQPASGPDSGDVPPHDVRSPSNVETSSTATVDQ